MFLNELFSSGIGGDGIAKDARFFLGTSGTSLSVERIPVPALGEEEFKAVPDVLLVIDTGGCGYPLDSISLLLSGYDVGQLTDLGMICVEVVDSFLAGGRAGGLVVILISS